MTKTQIRAQIKDGFEKGMDSIRYFYEGETGINNFAVVIKSLDGMEFCGKITRENYDTEERMLISPKLLKRLRINLKVVGTVEHKVEIVQQDKTNFQSNRMDIELNKPLGLFVEVIGDLLAKNLEREIVISERKLS